MEESEGQSPDPGQSESDVRTDQSPERDPRSREAERENATPRRNELAQSSEYPVRTCVEVCRFYLKNRRCSYGGGCKFNHPPLPQRNQMNNDMVQKIPYPFRPQLPYGMVQMIPYPVLPQLPEGGQMWHGMVQTSPYPVRVGVQDCDHYLRTGRCDFGSSCHFNHPPNRVAPVRPKRVIRQNCKFFRSGNCKNGSDCLYPHTMDSSIMRQASTESSSMAAKRARERDPGERLQDASVLSGYKRMRIEDSRRRQAQENMQRRNNERSQSRETEESVEEGRMKIPKNHEVNAQENLQRQEQADMERQTREAGEKAQEELRIDTKREEARSLINQIKPTVPSDNVDQIRESLTDIGIVRKEGDGF